MSDFSVGCILPIMFDFLYFFLLLSCFCLDFLSKLFVKTLNSTGNSQKMFSSKDYRYG